MNSKYEQIIRRIAEHIQQTMDYSRGIDLNEFLTNHMLQDACIFHVLQVGELAARAIEYGIDQEHPEIMWRQMRGMRNRIVHDYDGIRLAVIWDTITKDFPELYKSLSAE